MASVQIPASAVKVLLAFPDDRPCNRLRPCAVVRHLATRDDVTPLLLRPNGLRHAPEHLEETGSFPLFEVDLDVPAEQEGRRLRKWASREGLPVQAFMCVSEPYLEYWHALARAAGLPALEADSARWVRHKPSMKRRLAEAGLPVAKFLEVGSEDDSLRFAKDVGFPLIGKPTAGWGTIRTELLRDEAALRAWCRTGHDFPMMLEQFLSGQEVEVCALVAKGRVIRDFVSLMPASPLEVTMGALNANISLAARPDLTPFPGSRRVSQLVVQALRLTDGYLHMEVFIDKAGRAVFGEVAFRYPGCQIAHNHGYSLGIDIDRLLVDIHLGRQVQLDERPDGCVGDLLLPIREGRVVAVPTAAEVAASASGIIDVHIGLRQGDLVIDLERSSFNCSGWVHIRGAGPDEVVERMRRVVDSYDLVIAP